MPLIEDGHRNKRKILSAHNLVSASNNPARQISYTILIIFLLSFSLRLIYNQSVVFSPPVIRADAFDYYQSAKNMYNFGVYSKEKSLYQPPNPDSFRPPLLPLTIMLSMSAFKSTESGWYAYVILVQILLGSLIAPLIYYIAVEVSIPQTGAFIAALLTLLDPCLVTVTGYLLPEVYVSFFILLFLMLAIISNKKKSIVLIVLTGLSATLLYFSREEYLFAPLIMSAFYFREWPKGFIVLIFIFLLLPSLWMIRKMHLPESPSRLRIAAYEGSLPFSKTEGAGKYLIARIPEYRKFEPMKKGWDEFIQIMAQRIKESPELILWYFPQKTIYLLKFNFLQGKDIYIYPVLKSLWQLPLFQVLKTFSKYIFYCSIPLCMMGIYLCFKKRKKGLQSIGIVLIFYFTFFHIFVPVPKYMIPFRPIIYLFAISCLFDIFPKDYAKLIRLKQEVPSGKDNSQNV